MTKRISWRNWTMAALAGVGVMCLGLVGANLAVDTYGVLQTSKLPLTSMTNERYLKTEYLLQHPTMFNAFIVGSSTAGLIRPSTLTRLDPGMRYYNLAFLGGKPREVRLTLQALSERHVSIRKIVMPLDFFQFREQVQLNKEPSQFMHPATSGQSRLLFVAKYLIDGNVWQMLTKLDESAASMPNYRLHLEGAGNYELPKMDWQLRNDPQGYAKAHFPKTAKKSATSLLAENFNDFSDLVRWCHEHKVETVFFISPVNPMNKVVFGEQIYHDFVARIHEIDGQIHDYSTGFELTQFYDGSHYLPEVADQVLTSIWRDRYRRDVACLDHLSASAGNFSGQGSNCHGDNTVVWEKQS